MERTLPPLSSWVSTGPGSLGVGARETSPKRWVELETGPQFQAQANAHLALNKDVFTRMWEQAGMLLLASQNDDSTATEWNPLYC